MGNRYWRHLLIGVLCIRLLGSTFASAQGISNGYDRGYREGVQQVSRTATGSQAQVERNSVYRDGDRAIKAVTAAATLSNEFRRGFIVGLPRGYDRYRINVFAQGRRDNRRDPRVLRGYQDPAFARGYSDGGNRAPRTGATAIDTIRSATATIAMATKDIPHLRIAGRLQEQLSRRVPAGLRRRLPERCALPPLRGAVAGLERESRKI